MTRLDLTAQIKAGLNERLEDVLSQFWSGWQERGGTAYPAFVSKHDWGSFVVYLRDKGKYRRGQWFRPSASVGGDEINLFAYGVTGAHRATAEVYTRAKEFLGIEEAREENDEDRAEREKRDKELAEQRARQADEAARKEEDSKEYAAYLWRDAAPLEGTHGEVYLFGFDLPRPPEGWPSCLRYHRGLRYPGVVGVIPALLARVDDAAGNLTGVWREFIAADGGKAKVENQKMGLGPVAGGAVRIGGDAPKIGAAEGVRSALGAWNLIGRKRPVWSMLSTSGLVGFEPPMFVTHVTGFPDGDRSIARKDGEYFPVSAPPGRKAMAALGKRMKDAGIGFSKGSEPPPGRDYLDLWREHVREAA